MRTKIVALALTAGASAAMADQVQLKRDGYASGTRNVEVTIEGNTGVYVLGQFNFDVLSSTSSEFVAGSTLRTFCVDVRETLKGTDIYNVSPLEIAPEPGGPMGIDRANALRKMYTWALDGNVDFGAREDAVAFQLAIWEVVNDFNSGALNGGLDVDAGDFVADELAGSPTGWRAGVRSTLLDLLAQANTGSIDSRIQVGALISDTGGQDQIYFTVIPLPSSAGLAAAGLIGLAAFRRRRIG